MDTVGKVTSPVTHTEVVAVNNASIYGTALFVAELTGSARRILPANIAKKKLHITVCVVDSLKGNFLFIIQAFLSLTKTLLF